MADPLTSRPDPAAMARWTQSQVGALREISATRYSLETARVGTERDTSARKQWAAEQEAKAADQQVAREQNLMEAAREQLASIEQRASGLEAAGKAAEAAEWRQYASAARAKAEASEARWAAADDAAAEARSVAQEHGKRVAELQGQLDATVQQAKNSHDAAEALDKRAELYQQATPLAAEADRLAAAAAELRASGDEMAAADVDRAAAYVRRQADEAIAKAEQVPVDRAVVIDVLGPVQGGVGPASIPLPADASPQASFLEAEASQLAYADPGTAADEADITGPPVAEDDVATADQYAGDTDAPSYETGDWDVDVAAADVPLDTGEPSSIPAPYPGNAEEGDAWAVAADESSDYYTVAEAGGEGAQRADVDYLPDA